MNQTELIAAVAERAGLTKADAGKAVEALVGTITDTLKQGDEIRIAGFGTFGVSERGERQGRNPQTGEAITIAVHIFIDFGQLCSSKPTGRFHGNRTAVFMISTTCFQAGQHP